jgi:hypothetical protein
LPCLSSVCWVVLVLVCYGWLGSSWVDSMILFWSVGIKFILGHCSCFPLDLQALLTCSEERGEVLDFANS